MCDVMSYKSHPERGADDEGDYEVCGFKLTAREGLVREKWLQLHRVLKGLETLSDTPDVTPTTGLAGGWTFGREGTGG